MASEEEYIKKLEEHGLSREEIDRRVKEAISKMKGWIDEKTALFVVAKEEGIEVDSQAMKQSSEQDYTIEQLSESTQNVNVVGRVVNFTELRTFTRKDGTNGQFSWFWVFDSKDQMKVVLWDERAKIVKDNSFANNALVRVLNGQVKRNRDQELEIHIGARGDIEISPTDVNPSNYASMDYTQFKVKVADIHPASSINKNIITIEGIVDVLYDKRTFKKKATNEDLELQKIVVKDDSGAIPVTFWGKDTDLLKNVIEGTKISLENLSSKPQYKDPNKLELSYNNGSRFKVTQKPKPLKEILIKDIDTSLSRISTVAEVAIKNDIKTFTKKIDNSEGKLQRLQLQDKTGSIGIVFWQGDIEKLKNVEEGYTIKLENVNVQSDFRDSAKPELVFRSSSKLSVLSDSASSTLDNITSIDVILEKEGVYSIEGQITQIVEALKSITTTDGRTLKLFTVHVSDNTGAIQLTFWEDKAEQFADLAVGVNIRALRISSKKNDRIGMNAASFGKSSQIMKDIDFELTEQHTVPDFLSQPQTNEITPIHKVLETEGYYSIEGQITQIGEPLKTITTSDNRTLKLFSVHVSDNTGAIQLTFWEDKAEQFADLAEGENIRAHSISVKTNARMGVNSASFGRNSQLERDIDFELTETHEVVGFSQNQSTNSMSFSGKYKSIGQIDQDGKYELKGNITEVKRISVYEACAKCLKNISNEQTNCTCEEGPIKSVYRLIISAVLNDGTGDMPVTFFGDEAEKLIHQEAVTIHVKKQEPSYSEFEKEIVDSLKMMDLALIGTISPNNYSQEMELKVRDFKVIDLEEDDSINDLIDDIEN